MGEGVWSIVRPPSTLGYVSYFATWLLAVAFLSLALPGRTPGVAWRRSPRVAMLLTGTRAAMLGAAAGFAVWLWWRGWRVPRRALSVGALALIAAGVFADLSRGTGRCAAVRGGSRKIPGAARVRCCGATRCAWRGAAGAGYGPEVFTAEFPRYESAALARAYPDFAHESPHNIFLDALVAQGVPGVLLVLRLLRGGLAGGVARPDQTSRCRRRPWRPRSPLCSCAQQFTVFTIPTAVHVFCDHRLASAWIQPPRYVPLPVGLPCWALPPCTRCGPSPGQYPARPGSGRPQWSAACLRHLWYSRALLNARKNRPTSAPDASIGQCGTARRGAPRDPPKNPSTPGTTWLAYWPRRTMRRAPSARCAWLIAARPNWFKPHWMLAQLLLLEHRTGEAADEAGRAPRIWMVANTPKWRLPCCGCISKFWAARHAGFASTRLKSQQGALVRFGYQEHAAGGGNCGRSIRADANGKPGGSDQRGQRRRGHRLRWLPVLWYPSSAATWPAGWRRLILFRSPPRWRTWE